MRVALGDRHLYDRRQSNLEKKVSARQKILDFMLNQESTTKAELAKSLDLSMPTVLSGIADLTEKGLVIEAGEMESTGGRRARRIALQEDYCLSVGVDITAHHIGMVLVNLGGKIVAWQRKRLNFTPDAAYCRNVLEQVEAFYSCRAQEDKILGIGVSLPGIIHRKEHVLVKSHALHLENYSLRMLEQMLPLPVYFENDANAAMLAENPGKVKNAVYLSLSSTLGGAVCIDGELYTGQNRKAGEFGHMLLVPDGRPCYCGKMGCADAYCAASVLTGNGNMTLDAFMDSLGQDGRADRIWEDYLDNLSILISNLRMIFDTDIILGGDVGGYADGYLVKLREKVAAHNLFDLDASYLKGCSYRREASAVGVAKHFFRKFVEEGI